MRHNPFRVGEFHMVLTQASSPTRNPGFELESPWDSRLMLVGLAAVSRANAAFLVSLGIQVGDGLAELSFDGAVALRGEHFSAVKFPHVEAVDRGAFLGVDFRS